MKRMLTMLLVLLLVLPLACAEEGMTLIITEDMSFRGGPGMEYGQAAFNNYPPEAGESADVLGRCGEWLLVCYQGYWFKYGKPVWAYLHVSYAPEYANVPEMAFDPKPNALGVESSQLYADPEGITVNNWIPYDENGLTVLAVYGDMAYVDAVNPYGNLVRGFIPVSNLAKDPTAPELQNAPEGSAILTGKTELNLKYAPAFSAIDVIGMDGGNWALMYETERSNGKYGVVTVAVDRAGKVLNSHLLRTKDGDEESTLEFMLPTKSGFVVNRFDGNEDNTSSQTIFTFTGKKKGTDTKRYKSGEPYDTLGTAHFRVAEGSSIDAEEAGRETIPVEVRLLQGSGSTKLEIALGDYIPCVLEGEFGLLVPIIPGAEDADATRLLIFDEKAALMAESELPFCAYEVQMVPLTDGRVFLLACDAADVWRGYVLNPADGSITATGIALPISNNRDVALLAAEGERILLAIGGLSTQLLLTDGEERLLAAETMGMLIHAESDGQNARLLLLQNGGLRLETYAINMP